jgi:class 3 adenylate cyclase
VHHDDALVTARAPARLGTLPGAFAAVTAVALPVSSCPPGTLRGLVVLCKRAATSDQERAARRVLVRHFASVIADAHGAALAVFSAPPPETTESLGDSSPARARRAHLQRLSVRELLAIGAASGLAKVEAAETKRDMIAAILEAEGIPAGAPSAPLAPLPVPPRASLGVLSPEQRHLPFDAGARWLKAAVEREHPSLSYSQPGNWEFHGMPRPPVPPDESARIAAIERLGIAEMREWSAEDLAPFDAIAAGVAALAGASFGVLTLIHGEEQIVLGIAPRFVAPLMNGDAYVSPRATSLCQYTISKGAPLAITDTRAPEAGPVAAMSNVGVELEKALKGEPPRSYLGVPMVTTEGVILGDLCVFDDKPRPDFATNPQLIAQLEALAAAAVNLLELRKLRRENAELHARRAMDVAAVEPRARSKDAALPTDRVALLMTDIEGSTGLYERDSALMKQAQTVHDAILRSAFADNGGIELMTEGDAFVAAFHTAADAIRCCFDAQLRLLAAAWPDGLDQLGPATRTDAAQQLRGCRVRMTVHYTEAGGGALGMRQFEVSRHGVTRRPHYRGRVVDVCQFFSEMPSGGQVVVTQGAFDEVSLALTAALGETRVIDLGRYADERLGDVGHAYELLPRALAARRFDPPVHLPRGARLTSPGYIHAPRTSPLVIVFVFPVGLTELKLRSDARYARGLSAFTEAVRAALAAHGGYEMQENDGAFMCAFAHADARRALELGAEVHARITAATGEALRCRVGIHGGEVTIEPHASTGRMDAFGPTCNRAARLAKAASPGQTLVDRGTATAPSAVGLDVPLYDLGDHRFRGVEDTVRVVQIGDGIHQPIRSLSYASDLLEFVYRPLSNVNRTQTLLELMDALGSNSLPAVGGTNLERAEVEAVLEGARKARAALQTSTRIQGAPKAPDCGWLGREPQIRPGQA